MGLNKSGCRLRVVSAFFALSLRCSLPNRLFELALSRPNNPKTISFALSVSVSVRIGLASRWVLEEYFSLRVGFEIFAVFVLFRLHLRD